MQSATRSGNHLNRDYKHTSPAHKTQINDFLNAYKYYFKYLTMNQQQSALQHLTQMLIECAIVATVPCITEPAATTQSTTPANVESTKNAKDSCQKLIAFFAELEEAQYTEELENYLHQFFAHFVVPDITIEQYSWFKKGLQTYKTARTELHLNSEDKPDFLLDKTKKIKACTLMTDLGLPIHPFTQKIISSTLSDSPNILMPIEKRKSWFEKMTDPITQPIKKLYQFAKQNPWKFVGIAVLSAAVVTVATFFFPLTLITIFAGALYTGVALATHKYYSQKLESRQDNFTAMLETHYSADSLQAACNKELTATRGLHTLEDNFRSTGIIANALKITPATTVTEEKHAPLPTPSESATIRLEEKQQPQFKLQPSAAILDACPPFSKAVVTETSSASPYPHLRLTLESVD